VVLAEMLVDVFELIQPRARIEEVVEFNRKQELGRLFLLLPLRRQRMAVSPFSFFRGSAGLMAHDLRLCPDSGLSAQLCGDAHVMNFGFYASPERTLLFDLNDFDETAPGPFEWDLKRLAISCVLVARELGLAEDEQLALVKAVARQYRNSMTAYAEMNRLDTWYSRIRVYEFLQELDGSHFAEYLRRVADKSLKNDAARVVRRMCVEQRGELRFGSDLSGLQQCREDRDWIPSITDDYLETIRPELRYLLASFHQRDSVLKVVGVGSVGRRCCLVLLQGERPNDVMILQVKEAVASVLDDEDGSSAASLHHGRRVVEGQRLMQSASDPFLGWGFLRDAGHCYWRQFRDWKGSVELQKMDSCCFATYVELCAHALAKSHARTGDCVAISDSLRSTRRFAGLLGRYAMSGADQVELDFSAYLDAKL
jgi:uncharacterized protein (DUF2252 family)